MSGQIIIFGGPSGRTEDRTICDYLLEVVGTPRSRIAVLGTAGGDSPHWQEPTRGVFSQPCDLTFYRFFAEGGPDDFDPITGHDAIFVTGGNTVAMLAVWREYGLDARLRAYWEQGGTLAGWSAGALCWFESGTTDAYRRDAFLPFTNGLGLLPGSHCPHFDTPGRREAFEAAIASGVLAPGIGIDEDAIVHFRGTGIAHVLAVSAGATAHRTDLVGGRARTHALPAQRWNPPSRSALR